MKQTTFRNLQQDPPLAQDANYKFNSDDRQYIDDQIQAIEQHLLTSVLNGVTGTWFTNASGGQLSAGDVVCSAAASFQSIPNVTKATPTNLTAAGDSVAGVVIIGGANNSRVLVTTVGILPSSITGLASVSGPVRVSTAGRLERVSSYATDDIPVGQADSAGNLTLQLQGPAVTSGATPNIKRTVSGSTINAGTAVVTQGTNAFKLSTSNIGLRAHGVAIETKIVGQEITVQQHGVLDPAILSLGAGVACAVGYNSSGVPVRVTDPTCVPGLDRIGWCDTTGQIFVDPHRAPNFNVKDYGAVGACVSDDISGPPTDDLPAVKAALAAMTSSLVSGNNATLGELYFPSLPANHSYYLSDDLNIEIPCRILGGGVGGIAAQQSAISFAGGKGIVFWSLGAGAPNGGDATGASVEYLQIYCHDVPGVTDRQNNHAYNIGDVVRLKYTQAVYLVCIKAGTSASSEPVIYENPEDLQQNLVLYRGVPWASSMNLNFGFWLTDPTYPQLIFHVDSGEGQVNPFTTTGVRPTWNTTLGGTTTIPTVSGTCTTTTWSVPRNSPATDWDLNAGLYDGDPLGTGNYQGPSTGVLWAKKTATAIYIKALGISVSNCTIFHTQNYGISVIGHGLAPDAAVSDTFRISDCEINFTGGGIWTQGGEAGNGTIERVNVYTRSAISSLAPFAQHSSNSHCFLNASFVGNTFIGCEAQPDPFQNNRTFQPDTRVFNRAYWCSSAIGASLLVGCYAEGNAATRIVGQSMCVGGSMFVQENSSSAPSITTIGLQNPVCLVNDTGNNLLADQTKPTVTVLLGSEPYYAFLTKASDDNNSILAWKYGTEVLGWYSYTYQAHEVAMAVSTLRSADLGGLVWFPRGFYRGSSIGSAPFEFPDTTANTAWIRGGSRIVGDVVWRADVVAAGAQAFDIALTSGYEGSTWGPGLVYTKQSAPVAEPGTNSHCHPGSCVKPTDATNLNRFKIQSISGGDGFQAFSASVEPNWASAPTIGNTVVENVNGTFGTQITWVNVGAAPTYGRVDISTAAIKYTTQPETLWSPAADTDGTARAHVKADSSGLTTTNNTTTTVATYALGTSTLTYINVVVLAWQPGGPDAACFKLSGAWYRNGSSAPVQVKAPVVDESDANASGTAWTATLVLSGNNVNVRATGDTGKTIKWEVIRQGVEAT